MLVLPWIPSGSPAGPNPGTELRPPCLVKCQGAISTVGLQRPSTAYRSLGFTRSVRVSPLHLRIQALPRGKPEVEIKYRTLKLQVVNEIDIMAAVGDSHRNRSCNDCLNAGTK